nr:hypothetical protein [Tanacetum cinerariifolium]
MVPSHVILANHKLPSWQSSIKRTKSMAQIKCDDGIVKIKGGNSLFWHPQYQSTIKKSVAKKRTTPSSSSIPFSTDDPDAAQRVHITFASDDSYDDDTPHPIITGVHLLGWQVVRSGLGTLHTLLCHGGIRKTFTTLKEILHMVDRQTLIRLVHYYNWFWKMSLAVKSWKTYKENSSMDLPSFTGAGLCCNSPKGLFGSGRRVAGGSEGRGGVAVVLVGNGVIGR